MSAVRLATLAFTMSALCCWAPPAIAQSPGEACVTIIDNAQRLACFDRAFGTSPDIVSPPQVAEWVMKTETSRLVDQVDVYLTTDSRDVAPIDYGEPQRGRFQIRCRANVTTATFWIGGNYLSDYGVYGEVIYRIDNRAAQTMRGEVTADGEHIGLLSGATAIPFVKALFGAENLLISVRPVNQNDTPVELEFTIAGLEEAVAELRRACSW